MNLEILLCILWMQFSLATKRSDENNSLKKADKKSTTVRKSFFRILCCSFTDNSPDSAERPLKLIERIEMKTKKKNSDKTVKSDNETETTSLNESESDETQQNTVNPVTSAEDPIETQPEKDVIQNPVEPGTSTEISTKTESDNGTQMNLLKSEPHTERASITEPIINSLKILTAHIKTIKTETVDQNNAEGSKENGEGEITDSMLGSSSDLSKDTTSNKTELVSDARAGRTIEARVKVNLNPQRQVEESENE